MKKNHLVFKDDEKLWCYHRFMASKKIKILSLIGASRMQVGFHTTTFMRQIRLSYRMLAIDGSSPVPVLENLANDDEFSGKVLCSFMPMFFADQTSYSGRAHKWLRTFSHFSRSSHLNFLLNQSLGLMHPLCLAIEKTKAPMGWDRYKYFDFSRIDVEKLKKTRYQLEVKRSKTALPLTEELFKKRIETLNEYISKIKEKGGDVAFLRFPSSGAIRMLEEKIYPRKKYWDLFAKCINGLNIHFEDYDELKRYKCPDDSHLDVNDASKFTNHLIDILVNHGFLNLTD